MSEVARPAGKSSEIERGEVPELAVLGNVLRELFNGLGVSQRQYAKRIVLDAGAVSRYLGGRRLAPWRFVEQLIGEVGEAQGGSVTLEAGEAVRGAWLAALKACDPDEYRLEDLRSELARSKREIERAARTVEALHLLLEQKESQARESTEGLTRLRLDWAADRADAARAEVEQRLERDELLREIEELRNDLREAERLRVDAEARGRELHERVLRLEAQLAERGSAVEVPLDAFKGQLERLWVEEDFDVAARDLTEAAWARPVEEVVDLVRWLDDDRDEARVTAFLTDVCRLRPLSDVLRVVDETMPRFDVHFVNSFETMANAFASRITSRNAGVLYRALSGPDLDWDMGDDVLGMAVVRAATPAAAVELIVLALAGLDTPGRLFMTAARTARSRLKEGFPAAVVSGLVDAELLHVAGWILERLCSGEAGKDRGAEIANLHQGLEHLDEATLRTFFVFVAEQADWRVALRFADLVALAEQQCGDQRLTDQLVDLMNRKYWRFAAEHAEQVPDALAAYFNSRRPA